MLRLATLNLNGIRSAIRKGLEPWLVQHAPDCICVQELKAQEPDLLRAALGSFGHLHGYFDFAAKKGYSGVGIYSRHEPSDVLTGTGSAEFDPEGRYVEVRFDRAARRLSLISCYFPSGTSGEGRQQAKYRFLDEIQTHLKSLRREREFILCGDINIAHREIDLKNWRSKQKHSGFLPAERAWLSGLLNEVGLVDVYRHLHPDTTSDAYTWWSNRGRAWEHNVGWRIDYHLATPALAQLARNAQVYKTERFSDHAPLTIEYALRL